MNSIVFGCPAVWACDWADIIFDWMMVVAI